MDRVHTYEPLESVAEKPKKPVAANLPPYPAPPKSGSVQKQPVAQTLVARPVTEKTPSPLKTADDGAERMDNKANLVSAGMLGVGLAGLLNSVTGTEPAKVHNKPERTSPPCDCHATSSKSTAEFTQNLNILLTQVAQDRPDEIIHLNNQMHCQILDLDPKMRVGLLCSATRLYRAAFFRHLEAESIRFKENSSQISSDHHATFKEGIAQDKIEVTVKLNSPHQQPAQLEEASLTALLGCHPNITTLMGVYLPEENPLQSWCLVFEPLGKDLSIYLTPDRLGTKQPFISTRLDMMLQLQRAIQFLHSHDIYHLMLAPKSVFVRQGANGTPHLLLGRFIQATVLPEVTTVACRPPTSHACCPPETRESYAAFPRTAGGRPLPPLNVHGNTAIGVPRFTRFADAWGFGILLYQLWFHTTEIGVMEGFKFAGPWFNFENVITLRLEQPAPEPLSSADLNDDLVDDIHEEVIDLIQMCLSPLSRRPLVSNLHMLCRFEQKKT